MALDMKFIQAMCNAWRPMNFEESDFTGKWCDMISSPWTFVSLLPTCRTSKGVSSVVASKLSDWKKQGKTWQRDIISYFRSSPGAVADGGKTSYFFFAFQDSKS